MTPERAQRNVRRKQSARLEVALGIGLLVALFVTPKTLLAQENIETTLRDVSFEWNPAKTQLFVGLKFRDAVDDEIRRKLSRGLPTTIVLTAAVYRTGASEPVSTTAQTCKITWHIWDEVYLVEITRPGRSGTTATSTVAGVLRRCAETEATQLAAGTSGQIPFGVGLYVKAKVLVNPISPEILQKIKRWVSRPTGTGTAAPGDALFSTFTGLFLQRIGEAERELKFTTKTVVPSVRKPKR